MIWEFPEADPHWPLHLQPQWQQFMLGPSIMVAPILAAGAATVDVYFPRGSWYELWSGLNYSDASTLGRWQKIEAVPYQIPSYIRGGSILPTLVGFCSFFPLSFFFRLGSDKISSVLKWPTKVVGVFYILFFVFFHKRPERKTAWKRVMRSSIGA